MHIPYFLFRFTSITDVIVVHVERQQNIFVDLFRSVSTSPTDYRVKIFLQQYWVNICRQSSNFYFEVELLKFGIIRAN